MHGIRGLGMMKVGVIRMAAVKIVASLHGVHDERAIIHQGKKSVKYRYGARKAQRQLASMRSKERTGRSIN
jgi:hypothetical protein